MSGSPLGSNPVRGLRAVSYTHLDVYKRQDHARLYAEGTPLIDAAAHTRYVYELQMSTVRHPVDGRVERVGAGEVHVNVRQDPHPYKDGSSRNGRCV